MTRLALGVLLWSVVHFIPGIATDLKKNVIARLGENPYKGIFSLLMILAIYLIISGWKSTIPAEIFSPPGWGRHVALLFVLVGFVLFLAPYPPNNFKRILRHPQLVGMACWGIGHLLANGDSRSLVFFGGLTAWSLIEIVVLNRRDADWVKPEKVSIKKNLALVLFAVLVYLVFLYTHPLLFGVSPLT